MNVNLHPGQEVRLSDLAEVGPLLVGRGAMFSEYCFPNIFLFRHVHDYRFVGGKRPVIRGFAYDKTPTVMPLFDLTTISLDDLRDILSGADCLYPVSEAEVAHFDAARITLTWNDADSDYVYRTAHIAAYEGSELKKKRNLATRFIKASNPTVRTFEQAVLTDARDVLDQWFSDVEKPWADTDYKACSEALEHFETLGLFGVICYDGGGEPAGFLLASKIRDDMAAVHFAKGKRKFDGVFPYMFNQLAAGIGAGFLYLNFEQDLGKEGFRRSKKSYAPEFMLKKYRLSLR